MAVSGLTLGITHLWTATKTRYPTQSGSKLPNTDETITVDISAAPPAAGVGGALVIAAVAAVGVAYFMMRNPPSPKG